MDIDKIFESWEKNIKALETAYESLHVADVNYDSQMSKAIIHAKETHGMTIAKDTAKGYEDVQSAKATMLEHKRSVDTIKAKVNWLEQRYNWEKLKVRVEQKISTS